MAGEVRFSRIEEAIEDIRQGKMVVVVDDEDRENEGDLVMAAQRATPEAINFMLRHARGLLCVPMTPDRLRAVGLPLMVPTPGDHMGTAFTVSVDARHGVTTGESAYDRSRSIQVLVDPRTTPDDLVRPGHILPLQARPGGVLRRPGHTEAAVDLARLAGYDPAGVICPILNEDGTMARVPELWEFCRRHGLKLITIVDLIRYRMRHERLIEQVARVELPTEHGEFELRAYQDQLTGEVHLALVKGEVGDGRPVLVRMHSQCLTGDVFHSLRCDCGVQLNRAVEAVEREGRGVIVYLRQEGRGVGLGNKLRAYELQQRGMDTVEAQEALGLPVDARDYGIGCQILNDLGVSKLRLMTNNPRKYYNIAGYGLEIVERVPVVVEPNPANRKYLMAKRTKLGHIL